MLYPIKRQIWGLASFLAAGVLLGGAGMRLPAWALLPQAQQQYQQALTEEAHQNWPQAEYHLRQALELEPADALSYLKLGEVLAAQGLNDKAITAYEQAARLNPQDAMVFATLGNLYEQQNNPAQALLAYQTLLHKNPGYAFGYLAQGRVQSKLGQTPAAISSYRTFLSNYPTNVEAQRVLGRLLLANKQPKEAAEVLQALQAQLAKTPPLNTSASPTINKGLASVSDALPLAQALLASQQPQQALATLNQAQTANPSLLPGVQSDINELKARAYQAMGNGEASMAALQQAYEQEPTKAYLLLGLASQYQQNEQPQLALDAATRYLQSNTLPVPGMPVPDANQKAEAQTIQAAALLDLERYAEATPLLKALLTAEEKTPIPSADGVSAISEHRIWLKKQLGFALQQQGKTAEAITQYENLLQPNSLLALTPTEQTEVMRNLAIAYTQNAQLTQAKALYEKLALLPDQALPQAVTASAVKQELAQVMLSQAEAAYEKNEPEQAQSLFEATLNQTESATLSAGLKATAQLGLANSLYAQQRWQEAEAAYQAVWANPGATPSQKAAAGVYQARLQIAQKQNLSAAASQLQALLNAKSPLLDNKIGLEGYTSLASAYEALKQPKEAITAYTMAIAAANRQTPLDSLDKEALAPLHYNLATLQLAQQQPAEAKIHFEQALKLTPSWDAPIYGLAQVAEAQKNYPQARAYYQDYLKANPTSDYKETVQARLGWLNSLLKQPTQPALKPVTKPALQSAIRPAASQWLKPLAIKRIEPN